MARGLYRTDEGSVIVEYGDYQSPLSKNMYATKGYRPLFNDLPTQAQHNQALRNALDDEIRRFRVERTRSLDSGLGGMWADAANMLWRA